MSNFKKNDPTRRRHFEFNQNGEDELVLLIPRSLLSTLCHCFSMLSEKDTKDTKSKGYYITHRGTFKAKP